MKDFLASVASLLVIVGAVSIAPDSWFLDRVESISRLANENSHYVASISRAVEEVREDMATHLRKHNEDALVIAESINDTRLLTEEYFQRLSNQIAINSLETQIAELTGLIATEQAEIDRLERVINGNSAAPPSEETYRARERAIQYLDAYNAKLAAAVRELNRLMRDPLANGR